MVEQGMAHGVALEELVGKHCGEARLGCARMGIDKVCAAW